jgi:hypothetical protein
VITSIECTEFLPSSGGRALLYFHESSRGQLIAAQDYFPSEQRYAEPCLHRDPGK